MAWKNAWIQTLTDQGFNEMILYLPGAYEIFLQNILDIFEAYNETIKTCNYRLHKCLILSVNFDIKSHYFCFSVLNSIHWSNSVSFFSWWSAEEYRVSQLNILNQKTAIVTFYIKIRFNLDCKYI